MVILTRQQRETLVINLYNQGKTYREIAEEVRISPRDIGVILDKASKSVEKNEDNNIQASSSTRAYKLFSEGKTPIEVAIGLNLKESETARFYKEFWRLNQQHRLAMVYEEIKEDIVLFLKLYRLAKVEHMGPEDVVKLLVTASKTDGLRSFEQKCDWLDNEAKSLEMKIITSKQVLQTLDREIKNSRKVLDSLRSCTKQESTKISNLRKEEIKLKGQIRLFKKNNKDYQKIRQVAEERVSSLLADKKLILKLALFSLIESIRSDSNNYNNILKILSSTQTGLAEQIYDNNRLSLDTGVQSHKNSSGYENMLVEEAEKLHNMLVKDMPDAIIAEAALNNFVLSPYFNKAKEN